MSKFLFVTTYDLRRNTSGNIRTVALMNSLHDEGHVVHCIFVPSSAVSDRAIYTNLIKIDKLFTFPHTELSCIAKPEVNVQKKKTIVSGVREWLINSYSKISVYDVFGLSLMKLNKGHLEKLDASYDYIVSSSEPRSAHKFAEKIIKLKQYTAKWILYWGDPMSNDVASNKIFNFREGKEERRLISVSDLSIYTNPCAVSYMKEKYPDFSSKINWIPTTDFKKTDTQSEKGDIKKIGYFGDYRQMYRNIYPFYNACVDNFFSTTIIGGGDVEIPSKGTVKVFGRMTREEVDTYERDCGILVVLENISKTGNCIQVPGKLYHYGLTFKQILVITESSNIAKEYEPYNRFVFVKNNKEDIAKAIADIQSGKTDLIKAMPVDDFKYERIAGQFIKIIQ